MATKEDEERVSRREPAGELEPFWGPFRDFGWTRPWQLSRFMDEMLGERGRGESGLGIAMDVAEDENAWVVSAEIPGARGEDVNVDVHDDVLTIRGEKKSEREGKEEHHRWRERTYGSFSRSLRLPGNADPDRIEASFRNGVLTVEIPKKEESKPRTVTVQS